MLKFKIKKTLDYDAKLFKALNNSFFRYCIKKYDLWKRTKIVPMETI